MSLLGGAAAARAQQPMPTNRIRWRYIVRQYKETTVRWQHYRGWRALLPRRKSTNPPANSCDAEVTLCGSNCWCLLLSLENWSTLIPAVTAVQPSLLRPAACASEIAVIEPPTL